ncbi:MAG: iron uptake porin [Cyanobacteriota bacterium]|nr:iron uptake porin [Cyanobacteriota bacterium]
MKLFKQLLVAPAALGLLAPVATQAAELNMDAISKYSSLSSKDQVTSISQFSDVQPTDWAYQALSNLIERYGCVAGYPNGTYRGGKAMTRFEAAALLNACLDRVSEVTDELKRLMAEFEKELAVLKGRVDGLEAKVGVLEAQQFSTTTKLQGDMTFVLGGVGYGGNAFNPNGTNTINGNTAARNGVSFNYDMRLNFSTSWGGKDLLYTRLRAGNFDNSAFRGTPVGMAALDKASNSNNIVFVDRLYYRFPVGKEFTFTLGAIARNTEMIAFRPQAYNADILDFFTLAGAPGAYNKATGQGFGVVWKQKVPKGKPYLTASVNYVAEQGFNGDPSTGGIMSSNGRNNVTVQLGGRGKNWGAAALYRYGTCQTDLRRGTPMATADMQCNAANAGNNASSNSLGLGAYWQPLKSGWIPSVSIGWGYSGLSQSGNAANNAISSVSAAQSWAAMFQWNDAFAKGNAAGFAFGQGVMATATRAGTAGPNDSNYAFEWFYRFRVTDNISVSPAIFYLSDPLGQQQRNRGTILNNTGFLVQTRFKF